jgi:hypothetical protein
MRYAYEEEAWKCWTLWGSAQASPRRSLHPKCHTVPRYARKCTYVCPHCKSTTFPVPNFHEIRRGWTAVGADLWYRIACKWDNKCGMYGERFIEAPDQSMASAASIFVKFADTQYFIVGIIAEFVFRFYEECRKIRAKNSYTLWSKERPAPIFTKILNNHWH